MGSLDPRLRNFVKVQRRTGLVVPNSNIRRKHYPKSGGPWLEIVSNVCCTSTTTTTTSTTTTTTTT